MKTTNPDGPITDRGYKMIPNAWDSGNDDDLRTNLYQHISSGDIRLTVNNNSLSVWIFAAP